MNAVLVAVAAGSVLVLGAPWAASGVSAERLLGRLVGDGQVRGGEGRRSFADLVFEALEVGPAVRRPLVGIGVGLAGVSTWALATSPMVGVLVIAALVTVGLGRRWSVRPRGSRPLTVAEVVSVADVLASGLSTGMPLADVLDAAGRRAGNPAGLAALAARIRSGDPAQASLDRWAAEHPGAGADLVADALAVCGGSGAGRPEAMRSVAETLRRRVALEREVAALAAPARASMLVVATVPFAFAALVAAMDRRIAAFLLGTPGGLACLVGGVGLDLVGARWMAALVRGAAR